MSEARKENIRANCRAYYYRNHEEQKKRINRIYHKIVSTPEGRVHMRELQRKAGSRRRNGTESREFFLKKADYKCENVGCLGKSKTLHVHHIDNRGRAALEKGKKANNNPENIMVLCNSCHVGHHVWGWKIHRK